MLVPFLDLERQHRNLRTELLCAFEQVLSSADFVLGKHVVLLENYMAELCGTRYAVGMNSGTDALRLSLMASGIGSGDEVITSANTFIATLMAISDVGANPRLVDVDETYNMDPNQLERALTSSTRAIVPVHYTGRMADMKQILEFASDHGLVVIEDAAQAIGARREGHHAGGAGSMGCFSFHPTKVLGACGDGGVVTTDDPELAKRLRRLRNLGRTDRDVWVVRGLNSRLDSMQAAILLAKTRHLPEWIKRRRQIAEQYAVSFGGRCRVPLDGQDETQVYHLYVLALPGLANQEAQAFLHDAGIDARIHYLTPVYRQKPYTGLGYSKADFPITEQFCRTTITLPLYPEMTEAEVSRVIGSLNEFLDMKGIHK